MPLYSINKVLSRQVRSLNNLINGNVAMSYPPIYEKKEYLAIIPRALSGYEIVNSQRGP